MKHLILIVSLLIAFPPVQAGFCGEGQGDGVAQEAEGHHGAGSGSGHDCCPDDSSEGPAADESCDGQFHCASCLAGMTAAVSHPAAASGYPHRHSCTRFAERLAPSHSAPPFRPPIS